MLTLQMTTSTASLVTGRGTHGSVPFDIKLSSGRIEPCNLPMHIRKLIIITTFEPIPHLLLYVKVVVDEQSLVQMVFPLMSQL